MHDTNVGYSEQNPSNPNEICDYTNWTNTCEIKAIGTIFLKEVKHKYDTILRI